MTVASALLVDYVLTVAVSISSGAQYAASAIPALSGHEAAFAVVMVLLLMTMNLRGVRESGAFFAIPTYLFMASIMAMCVWGLLKWMNGTLPNVDSAQYHIIPAHGYAEPLGTVALVVLITRAFSSGSAALTGVEAISNGVPAFRKPKSKNAATTLLLLGTIAITMMMGVIALANLMHLRFVDPGGLRPAAHRLRRPPSPLTTTSTR